MPPTPSSATWLRQRRLPRFLTSMNRLCDLWPTAYFLSLESPTSYLTASQEISSWRTTWNSHSARERVKPALHVSVRSEIMPTCALAGLNLASLTRLAEFQESEMRRDRTTAMFELRRWQHSMRDSRESARQASSAQKAPVNEQ